MPDNPLSQQSPSSLNLSSITDEFLNSPEVTGAPPATPATPPAQEVAPAQEEVTPPLQTQPESKPELPDDPQERERGFLRDDDYRRKTMKLADERRAFEAERSQLAQQLQQAQAQQQEFYRLAHDPAFLQQQWQLIQAQSQAQDPNAPLTVQQVNHLLQSQLAETEKKLANYVQRIEVQRNQAVFDQQRVEYAQQLLKEFPLLEDQEGVDRLISAKAWERHPSNMNELKQFMREEAETRNKRAQKRIDDNVQAAIMRQAKAQKPGMEPKGGTVPVLQIPQRKHKLGSSDLLQDTMEWLKTQDQS
jgi:hypothetical protein